MIKGLLWKIPAGILGAALGLVLLLLIAAAGVVLIPDARTAVLRKGVEIANEQTDLDIDLGRLYLSPFHHSPMVLYRAYKGEADLPLHIEVDSLFVGHRGQDTLLYVHALRLRAVAKTATSDGSSPLSDPMALPIVVDELQLDRTTFHSGSLIEAVGVDVIVDHLGLSSPGVVIARGEYPLHGLDLSDTYVGISLRDTPEEAEQDTTPLLMAYDVKGGLMRNVHFELLPLGLNIHTDYLATDVLADVGGSCYDAQRLNAGNASLRLGSLYLPFDTLYGDAKVDLAHTLITSQGLHARSEALGAQADLSTTALDLETMRVDVEGDANFRGSQASLRAMYDIDDEAYDAHVEVEKVDVSPFLKDSPPIVLAGTIDAKGQGIDPKSRAMKSKVKMHLTDCIYDNIDVSGLQLDAELANQAVAGTLHLPVSMQDTAMRINAQTDHTFRVAEFMTPERMQVDYHSDMRRVRAHVAGEDIAVDSLQLDFATADSTSLALASEGLNIDAQSPMHVLRLVDQIQPLLRAAGDSTVIGAITSLRDLTMLDTLRELIPELKANIELTHGSPAQSILEKKGLDIRRVALSLASDSAQTDLALDASIPEISHPEDSTALRLPATNAAMRIAMAAGRTTASLTADSKVTDGAMALHDLRTDASLRMDLERTERELNGTGRLTLDNLSFTTMDLGSRTVDINVSPSARYANALKADVRLDDIPLDLVDSIIQYADLDLNGAVRATAAVDGLPAQVDLSAEVTPIGVSAEYKPYEIILALGDKPITMEHNRLALDSFPIYGVDSTYLSLTGEFDLNSMLLDVALAADSFAPAKLVQGGPAPVYGELATDIHGRVSGPLDSIVADVDVTLLPVTDITYPIDKKNMAQVKPHGTVNVKYDLADSKLDLGGRVNVDEGFIRYSPKVYPMMPFHVDSGSHIAFNGPIGRTMLDVSASQQVKASVQSEGEETRRVDFTTGVRVQGELDSIGMNAIGFFLEAPNDETITRELTSMDEDTRDGVAATLLATGMYVGESNAGAQQGGYALSSIINSRINAAMANSKMGKVVDVDFSSGKSKHAAGETNDMNISISKSLFKDKLRISVGATISDNPDVMTSNGLLSNLSADYKLTKDGNVLLRVFAQRDYNNILEGELYKSGIGVRATRQWVRRSPVTQGMPIHTDTLTDAAPDSITRTYGLTADADVAWRSNNSLGPNLTLTSSVKNLLGRDEILTVKGTGAYYWALRERHPGDPKKSDTYKFGINASLVFPYLHWMGDNNPQGDTRYMVGYQYENIAGGYGVHKLSGSFTYFIRQTRFITHAFTPFSLSIVGMKAESPDLLNKAAEYPQLIKLLASDEFVPAIGYHFTYNDYRAKRGVNTMLDLGIKESGNLTNAIYCLFGHKWDEKKKPLGKITFNQFVKLSAELRNKFNFTESVCIATRLYAGANIPLGNSNESPLSEAFYAGGPNSMRAASPYAYGPGNFYSEKYNQNFFHSGDVKLEANFELRFPIVWKLYGAAFVDAGNVWNWYNTGETIKEAGYEDYTTILQLREELYDGVIDNKYLARQIALGTGAGLRLDFEGLVIRLDLGVAIHAPYQTYKYQYDKKKWYDKDSWTVDKSQPINTYFNLPSALDVLRLNFGIGYPF